MATGPISLKGRTRQLQMSSGPLVSNKNRRLTSSVSSSNIPQLKPVNAGAYNTVGQGVNTGR